LSIFRKPIDKIKNSSYKGSYGRHLRKKHLLGFIIRFYKPLIALIAIGTIAVIIIVFQIASQLPDVEMISTYVPDETTKIYSSEGGLIADLHKEENRAIVPINQISDYVKLALLAAEDSNFYNHYGIDIKGIARAFVVNVIHGSAVQGASTITQQLARNVFLNKRKKIIRKIAEILLSLQIEKHYTKEEIMEFYLNQVYWGHNSYGIESAASLYFGKKAEALTLRESAMLVGILRGPEYYSPFRNPSKAKYRKDFVLSRMLTLGFITPEEYFEAKDTPIQLTRRKQLRFKAPYFSTYVVKQLEEMYGEEIVYSSGLRVFTSLNLDYQQKAEDVLRKKIDSTRQDYWIKGEKVPSLNCNQGAILSLDPRTGHILTWVGGYDFLEREFDHIYQAKRQLGSAFKPFTYLTALNMGLSPGTVLDDSPVTFNTIEGPYAPQNYSKKYRGKINMRRALELSINVVAIKICDLIDPSNIIVTCRKLGLTSYLAPVLSLTLGASEVNMLEVASAYTVFANSGVKVDPVAILRIEDRNGNVLYKHELKEKRVFPANKIYMLVDMMRGVVLRGTGRGANIHGYHIAGKTGTTNDYRDAWFFGYTPNIVTACWMGNDDNSPMHNVTGGWLPAQMWREYMSYVLPKRDKEYFRYPRGAVRQKICLDGKCLAGPHCPKESVIEDYMWRGHEYTEHCQVHGVFSGVTGFSTSRPDWEKTFFPNKNKIVYLNNKQEEEEEVPTEDVKKEIKQKKNIMDTMDLGQGI